MTLMLNDLWGTATLIASFLLVLGGVVFVHEFGHFFVARRCGVKVEVFSIGMGPEVLGRTDRRGARWRLSAIPVGGYVRFAGDRDAASAPDEDALSAMPPAERRETLAGQPVLARAAIVAAGPIANLVAAVVVLSAIAYAYGERYLPPRVDSVVAGSPAEQAGFAPGDVIESVNGRTISSFDDIIDVVTLRAGEPLRFVVDRGGHEIVLTATPALTSIDTPAGSQRAGRLGLVANASNAQIIHPTPLGAIKSGLGDSWRLVSVTGDYLSRVVTGRSAPDQLSGPVRIAKMSGAAASLGPVALLKLAAILSLSLGLMNLLPVPMLDGGHLLFYAIEAARGRPLSRATQDFALRIGAALVVALMLFVTFNDIRSLITG
jgi:regulator of sigma E protease